MKGLLYKDLHLFPRIYKVQIAISLLFFAGFFFWERQISLLATATMMVAVSVLAYLYADACEIRRKAEREISCLRQYVK